MLKKINTFIYKNFITLTEIIAKSICDIHICKYLQPIDNLRIVNYHGIGDGKSPFFRKFSDEVSLEIFRKQIDFINNNYEILSLSEAIFRVKNKKFPKKIPICCITFDDGLQTVYTKAFPILKSKSIPALIFLNTDVIDNHKINWIHLISYLLTNYGYRVLSDAFNKIIKKKNIQISFAPADEKEIITWYHDNYERNFEENLLQLVILELGLHIDDIAQEEKIYLSWDQVLEMDKYDIAYASHTSNHAPLSYFSKDFHINDTIVIAYHAICDHNEKYGDFVSFPFGMKSEYGKRAIKYAFIAGHKYILEIGNGLNPSSKVLNDRIISRVGLGNIGSKRHEIYAAIELRPIIKNLIRAN